jgi:predicted Rossmann fold nucleotide-binding protein DprA/Smf involved in DNA uptake
MGLSNLWRALFERRKPAMMTDQSHGEQIVTLLQGDIYARELALISLLAAGQDGATERAVIANLYRTLRVAMQSLGKVLPTFDYP